MHFNKDDLRPYDGELFYVPLVLIYIIFWELLRYQYFSLIPLWLFAQVNLYFLHCTYRSYSTSPGGKTVRWLWMQRLIIALAILPGIIIYLRHWKYI
jgi:hypothetical protein